MDWNEHKLSECIHWVEMEKDFLLHLMSLESSAGSVLVHCLIEMGMKLHWNALGWNVNGMEWIWIQIKRIEYIELIWVEMNMLWNGMEDYNGMDWNGMKWSKKNTMEWNGLGWRTWNEMDEIE